MDTRIRKLRMCVCECVSDDNLECFKQKLYYVEHTLHINMYMMKKRKRLMLDTQFASNATIYRK